jgi:circadian clock protein KaiC
MITRLLDYLKLQTITALFTELVPGPPQTELSIGISSLMDTWIVLAFAAAPQRSGPETVLEWRRTVQVLKSRGMSHAKDVRSFEFCSAGINILGTALGAEEQNDTVMARKLRHEKKRR